MITERIGSFYSLEEVKFLLPCSFPTSPTELDRGENHVFVQCFEKGNIYPYHIAE